MNPRGGDFWARFNYDEELYSGDVKLYRNAASQPALVLRGTEEIDGEDLQEYELQITTNSHRTQIQSLFFQYGAGTRVNVGTLDQPIIQEGKVFGSSFSCHTNN